MRSQSPTRYAHLIILASGVALIGTLIYDIWTKTTDPKISFIELFLALIFSSGFLLNWLGILVSLISSGPINEMAMIALGIFCILVSPFGLTAIKLYLGSSLTELEKDQFSGLIILSSFLTFTTVMHTSRIFRF